MVGSEAEKRGLDGLGSEVTPRSKRTRNGVSMTLV
jgi:hypothetical protein